MNGQGPPAGAAGARGRGRGSGDHERWEAQGQAGRCRVRSETVPGQSKSPPPEGRLEGTALGGTGARGSGLRDRAVGRSPPVDSPRAAQRRPTRRRGQHAVAHGIGSDELLAAHIVDGGHALGLDEGRPLPPAAGRSYILVEGPQAEVLLWRHEQQAAGGHRRPAGAGSVCPSGV